MAFGVFEPLDKTCYNFVYLSSICVKISKDPQSGLWALNQTWGGSGCVGDPYSPTVLNVTAGYSVLRITEPEEIDYYLPFTLGNVQLEVRSGHDPYLLAKELTDDSFEFGMPRGKRLYVGFSLFFICMLMAV